MEVKVKIEVENVEEAKKVIDELIEKEKEHSPNCTLVLEITLL